MNGGFESPVLSPGGSMYSAPAPWTGTGYGGFSSTGGFGATAPEGNQFGLVEIFGGVSSSLSQSVIFPTTGQYILTYLDGDRPSFGGISYNVELLQSGTTTIAAGLVPTGTTFAPRSFTFSAVAGAGSIRFFADGSSGANRAVFLDSCIGSHCTARPRANFAGAVRPGSLRTVLRTSPEDGAPELVSE